MNRKLLILFWAVLFAFAFGFAQISYGQASSCSAHCDPELCYPGGCSVSSNDCSAACVWGGCTYRCRLIGPKQICNVDEMGSCPSKPPPYGPQKAEPKRETDEWAIVKWDGSSAKVLAASSQSYAESFVQKMLQEIEKKKLSDDASQSHWPSMTFNVDEAHMCIVSFHSIGNLRKDVKNIAESMVYIRGETRKDGHLAKVKILYSTAPWLNDQWKAVLMKNLKVMSQENLPVTLHFFAHFGVSETGGLSYTIISPSTTDLPFK